MINIKEFILLSDITMAPRYEICVGLEKGHKTTKNTLKVENVTFERKGFLRFFFYLRLSLARPRER